MAETATATATNPTDASASTEAAATLLASASNGTDGKQQTQNAQTQQPEAAAKPAEGTQTPEAKPAAGAPEKYDFKAPEGMEYDPEILESFSGAAKEAGLTQDAAQKLIEKMAPAITARQADQIKAIHEEWVEASKTDKEFGGEKLQENLGTAKKGLDLLDPVPAGTAPDKVERATPLRALLEETGLGNHPEFIRLMYRAGKAISEDKFVGGHAAGAGKVNATTVLYDNTGK